MNILSLRCDNLFMFKDFSIDFTYKKQRKNRKFEICEQDALFPDSQIFVKKRLLILGGNASGKTTFGKLLCAINNYIIGREVKPGALNLYRALYDKHKKGFFEIEFVIDTIEAETKAKTYWAYKIGCEFDIMGNMEEYFKRTKVYKSYRIEKLRQKLDVSRKISSEVTMLYPKDNVPEVYTKADAPFVSTLLKSGKNQKYLDELRQSIGFHYIFSSFADNSQEVTSLAPIDLFNQVLPQIDNSISSVEALTTEGSQVKTNSYLIRFKNGEQITVPENNLLRTDRDRMSHGTYEVLAFLGILAELKDRKNNIFYIDEQLAHLHAELEAYLVMRLFYSEVSSQLFFTSHDNELLELNVPVGTYLLFKRNEDQSNTAVFMDSMLHENSSDIRYYYDNDYFGIIPDYSALDPFFNDEAKDDEET